MEINPETYAICKADMLLKGEGDNATELHADPDARKHVIAHVFKVTVDPYVGRMGIFRIHQGAITKDSQLFIDDNRKPFKVGHLFRLKGKDHIEIEQAVAGDILVAVAAREAVEPAVRALLRHHPAERAVGERAVVAPAQQARHHRAGIQKLLHKM